MLQSNDWPSLKAFARWWWASTPIMPPEGPAKLSAQWFEFLLFRRGWYQVELIALFPGAVVPAHKHPNVETYEVHLSGGGDAWLGEPARRLPKPRLVGDPLLRRLRIAAGVPHGGFANRLTTAISLQRWSVPHPQMMKFITDDWETA